MSPLDSRALEPSQIAARAAIALAFAVLLAQLLHQADAYPLRKMTLGNDYAFYHRGAEHLLRGEPAHRDNPSAPPPLSAALAVPLHFLGLDGAIRAFMAILAAAALASAAISAATFLDHGRGEQVFRIACVLVFGFPLAFALDRMNMDLIATLCLAIAVYLESRDRPVGAGLALALGFHAKIYPALLLMPLLARRRWRSLGAFSAGAVALALPLLRSWVEYLPLIRGRTGWAGFRGVEENASLANTLVAIADAGARLVSRWAPPPDRLAILDRRLAAAATVTWAALLIGSAALDALSAGREDGRTRAASLLLYVPFMVAWPQLAYAYELTALAFLLPALDHLWREHGGRLGRFLLAALALAITVAQFPAGAAERILGSAGWMAVPGYGLALSLLLSVAWRVARLRDGRLRGEGARESSPPGPAVQLP